MNVVNPGVQAWWAQKLQGTFYPHFH